MLKFFFGQYSISLQKMLRPRQSK